jgi:hypothetical protein
MSIFAVFCLMPAKWGAAGHPCLINPAKIFDDDYTATASGDS